MRQLFACQALTALSVALSSLATTVHAAEEMTPERIDYLTFAQGAVPIFISSEGAKTGTNFEHAVKIIDGNSAGFVFVNKGKADTSVTFVYELPATTTFDRFAVPNVLETPSPSTTFTRVVEVFGSTKDATAGYELIASTTLSVHKKKGEVTELAVVRKTPVRWIKVKLSGGIDLPKGEGFLEFSELVGNGTQEPAALTDKFDGVWKQRANIISLSQDGAVVSGCYDRSGDLTGTVTGNVLRATGVDRSDKTMSAFILSITPDGELRGVRSSNGAPFRLYTTPPAPKGTKSSCETPVVKLGCGSIIHGINFDYDSALIRQDAAPVLSVLYDGLKNDKAASISIEGHTSSEGTTRYNQLLSERRAQAVVADLTKRGIAASRLAAVGVGEERPIARNDDESGRAINRRVQVVCK